MKVNPKTLLFEDLTADEKSELLRMVKEIVMEGKVPPIENKFIDLWLNAFETENNTMVKTDRFLLMVSVAFPQRALLSLL